MMSFLDPQSLNRSKTELVSVQFLICFVFLPLQNLIAKLHDKKKMVCGPDSDVRLVNKQVKLNQCHQKPFVIILKVLV